MNEFDDKTALESWQKDHNPETFTRLMIRYRPIVNSAVNKFKTVGLSPATLRAQATSQVIRAMKTYDPSKETQPTTHIWNSMMKIQRAAVESLTSGHIPEYRNMKRSTFMITRDNLADRLGYEPSVDDMADELKWSKGEVSRMNNELGGEVTASGADFDFYGNSTSFEHKDKALADLMYHELAGPEKVVFEHTFGVGGKPILSNKEMALKLSTNEMAIHRMKKKMADKIRSYR